MRIVFKSNDFGTANGFNAYYEIRPAFKEEIPTKGNSLKTNEDVFTLANLMASLILIKHIEMPCYILDKILLFQI